jgi:hypothetical protein
MKNKIGNLEENALIEGNYHGNSPAQMPIYLIIDWENRTINVCTRNYQIGGTPARQWNGFEHAIQLPANIDAERLASDVDQYYAAKLDKICDGWSEEYDGNNYKGHLTEEAQELLSDLEQEIETTGGNLSTLDEEKHTEYLIDKEIIDEEGNPTN